MPKKLVSLVLLFSFLYFVPDGLADIYSDNAGKDSLAKEGNPFKDERIVGGALYNIFFEISSYEGMWVEGVNILGTEKIEGKTYLVIKRSEAIGKKGYILFDSVKAILPSDIKPKTIYDTKVR